MNNIAKRVEEIAVELANVRSVVGTDGEIDVIEKANSILRSNPYFKKHPENIKFIPVKNDVKGRKSIMAYMEGKSNKTVVLLGHLDTVGISDYGDLMDLCTDPYKLTEKFKTLKNLDKKVIDDANSDEYLFGRGMLDMKTGNAAIIALMEKWGENMEEFDGSIVYIGVIDEEGSSNGMLSCVPELLKFRDEKKLEYKCLLDTDYITSEYEGDDNKYIYVGTVGKIMPSFYVVGKETHVGESFKGLDPNEIASAIVTKINLNPEFSDTYDGETTLPPISLKLKDLKTEYSVQTARTTNIYFNYATHSSTPDEIMEKMLKVSEECMTDVIENLNKKYENFCTISNRQFTKLPWKERVMSFNDLVNEVEKENPEFKKELKKETERINVEFKDLDERDKSLKIVEFVHNNWSIKDPVIVVYFAPPYYPHIKMEEEIPSGKLIIDAVKGAIASSGNDYKLTFKKFFPYISDLSYGAAPTDKKVLELYEGNTPGYGTIYELPLKEIASLDLQVLNIGAYGMDAHKFTERVHKDYSFRVLPDLVEKTVEGILK